MKRSFHWEKHDRLFVCLGLVLITLAGYWGVHRNDFINYDDTAYVVENRMVTRGLTLEGVRWAFTTGYQANWHPLTWLSHQLDYQIYGLNPAGHHMTNLLFHIANVLLLFLVLLQLTGDVWPSAAVAVLFAVHPLHVQSVAWVSERKDVLSTFFWLLVMAAYVRYTRHPKIRSYGWVLVLFSLGLMAKPMLVTLPFVLLLVDYWPLKRYDLGRSPDGRLRVLPPSGLWLEKVPLFVLMAASITITFFVQKSGGAVSGMEAYPLGVRIANAAVSYVTYMAKTFWPTGLAVFYPHLSHQLPLWEVIGAGLLLVLISLWVLREVRGRPYLFVGWFWYLGILVPVIGLVQVGLQAMADRYTYIPMIGLGIMVSWGLKGLSVIRRIDRRWLMPAPVLLILILIGVTRLNVSYWRNSLTLSAHALRVTRNNYIAHANYGNALLSLFPDRNQEALDHYRIALQLKPETPVFHFDYALALEKSGEREEAIEEYRLTLKIDPNHAMAHLNLGIALHKQGGVEEAMGHYREVLRVDPESAKAHYDLGIAYSEQGNFEEAAYHFRAALRIDPGYEKARRDLEQVLAGSHGPMAKPVQSDAQALVALGNRLARQGRLEEAMPHFSRALQTDPDCAEAHLSVGNVRLLRGKTDQAIESYAKAVAIRPNMIEAHLSLAKAYTRKGLTEKIAEQGRQALQIDPSNADAHLFLADAVVAQGQITEAIEHYTSALKIRPDDAEAAAKLGRLRREEEVAH